MCNFQGTSKILIFNLKFFLRKNILKNLISHTCNLISGDYGVSVTPVPIPNTMVKPHSADDTAWETEWKSRTLPGQAFRDSSMVEHSAVNRRVGGSSPLRGAIFFDFINQAYGLIFIGSF